MKKLSIAYFFFLITFCLGAQDSLKSDSKLSFGFSFATHFTRNTMDNFPGVFGLTLKYKKIILTGGPKIFFERVYGSDGTWLKYKGFNTDLRFYPWRTEKKLRVFFNFNTDFMSQSYRGKVYAYPLGGTVYNTYNGEYFDKTLCFNAGIGIQWRIVDKLNFSLNAGAGYSFFALDDVYRDMSTNQIIYEEHINFKDRSGPCGLFSLMLYYFIN